MFSLRFALVCGFALLVAPAHADKLDPDHPPVAALPQETRLGDEAVKELERDKKLKWLDQSVPANRTLQQKLNALVSKLGASSSRAGIAYSVKVIEDPDINAFTLPGGHIYLYRGLIDFASSDDELAGVLAHELGHNARLHALRGERKAKKLNWVGLAALAAMIGGGQNGADVARFSQFALIGALNGYGVGLEKEADASAIDIMRGAGFNPSALVTFMGRLQVEETHRPDIKLGIFATHPPSDERANLILSQMKRESIPFTPREVSGAARFVVIEKSDRVTVAMNDLTLLEFAKTPDAKERAQSVVSRLNALWEGDLKAYEIAVSPDGALSARGQTIARPTVEDAKMSGLSTGATGQKWASNFTRLFWRLQLKGKT